MKQSTNNKTATKATETKKPILKLTEKVGEVFDVVNIRFVQGKFGMQILFDTTEGIFYISYPSQLHGVNLLDATKVEVYEEEYEGKKYTKVRTF